MPAGSCTPNVAAGTQRAKERGRRTHGVLLGSPLSLQSKPGGGSEQSL